MKDKFIHANNEDAFVDTIFKYLKDTALHIACGEGYLSIVQYLIEKGANSEAENIEERTPFHFACKMVIFNDSKSY